MIIQPKNDDWRKELLESFEKWPDRSLYLMYKIFHGDFPLKRAANDMYVMRLLSLIAQLRKDRRLKDVEQIHGVIARLVEHLDTSD